MWSQLRRDKDRGAVLVMVAAGLIMIFGLGALVLDILNVHQNRVRAQATADASVLAAAQDLPDYDLAVISAKEYALRNFGVTESDWAGCTDSGALGVAIVPCISMNATGTEVRVRLPARSVPAFFAYVLGKDRFLVSATATAELEPGILVSGPGSGTPGDTDPATPNLHDGDPGGGYPVCENLADTDWEQKPPPGSKRGNKWSEFIFVFEHLDGTVSVICGTSRAAGTGNEAWVLEAGGNSATNPTGIQIHVSCSDIFVDGWTDITRFSPPHGPLPGIDTEWRVIRYTIDKYNTDKKTGDISFNKRCGEEFTPVTSEPPELGPPNIRLID